MPKIIILFLIIMLPCFSDTGSYTSVNYKNVDQFLTTSTRYSFELIARDAYKTSIYRYLNMKDVVLKIFKDNELYFKGYYNTASFLESSGKILLNNPLKLIGPDNCLVSKNFLTVDLKTSVIRSKELYFPYGEEKLKCI